MKKVLLLAALLITISASAQNNFWRKSDASAAQKNSITALGSVQGWGSYHSWGFGHIGLEYARALSNRMSISAIALHAPMNGNTINDGYAQDETFTFAGAKVNYTLPVASDWLHFRFGAGGGVGWHKITGYEMGYPNPDPAPAFDTYAKAHLMIDAYWVLRATKWLDLRFSPLIVSPSQFIVGGKFNAPYNSREFFYFNMGALGATVRF